ncbi:hypothetical protein DVH05_000439 [Phytophthora capsici]|nr:hypothetical protein DVH05_000439 [Phytophthora capsici]
MFTMTPPLSPFGASRGHNVTVFTGVVVPCGDMIRLLGYGLRFPAFLNGKVAELEQQLKHLQLRNSNMPLRRQPAVQKQVHVPRVWKDISTRQRRRRDEAQRENARLKRIVERKKKLATGLSSLLRKQLTQEGVLRLTEEKQNTIERRATRVLDFRGDIAEFQDLFHHLEAAHHEIDAVFASNGLSAVGIPTDDVHIREDVDAKGGCVGSFQGS